MTLSTHQSHVDSQFGKLASAYLTSQVHASGNDLKRLKVRLADESSAQVLDIGCGAGHVSFIAAEVVAQVIAYDLSGRMLDVVSKAARERHLNNIVTCQGIAEQLPFSDNSMDIVISRYSAHHWQDLGMALREVKRVLKSGGRAIFMDVMSPGIVILDIWLQTIEALRDTSHVSDYSAGEWLSMFNSAGLMVKDTITDRLRLEFSAWIARMQTPTVILKRDAIPDSVSPERTL